MTDDLLKIPKFLDRRGETYVRPKVTKRKLTMPNARRVAAMKKEKARIDRAKKRAEAKDTAKANATMEAAEKAAALNRKTK